MSMIDAVKGFARGSRSRSLDLFQRELKTMGGGSIFVNDKFPPTHDRVQGLATGSNGKIFTVDPINGVRWEVDMTTQEVLYAGSIAQDERDTLEGLPTVERFLNGE